MARGSNDGQTLGCARTAHPNHERMIVRFEPGREAKPARSASAWGKSLAGARGVAQKLTRPDGEIRAGRVDRRRGSGGRERRSGLYILAMSAGLTISLRTPGKGSSRFRVTARNFGTASRRPPPPCPRKRSSCDFNTLVIHWRPPRPCRRQPGCLRQDGSNRAGPPEPPVSGSYGRPLAAFRPAAAPPVHRGSSAAPPGRRAPPPATGSPPVRSGDRGSSSAAR
jgi:hypothetical protein